MVIKKTDKNEENDSKILKKGGKTMNNTKLFKKVICLVISLMMLIPNMPSNLVSAVETDPNGNIAWPNPGSINLRKEATKTGDGRWKINLTVEGKNLNMTSDVVLVIDRSGSMGGTKMNNTKAAAKAFVNNLLIPGNSSTRIAIVSFNDSAATVSDFKGIASKDELLTAIDGIKVDTYGGYYTGGTYMQAGIKQAHTLLGSSAAVKKSIVLLGDGEPTYSTKVTNVTGATVTKTGSDVIWDFSNAVLTFGTSRVGNGNDYTLGKSSKIDVSAVYGGVTYTAKYPDNNGQPTIYQAKLAKNEGFHIYSIALSAGTNGEFVLKNSASSLDDYYVVSSDTSVLTRAFASIAGSISYAARDSVIIDPMGPMFDLVKKNPYTWALEGTPEASTADIVISQGSISNVTSTQPNTISWNAGNIVEGTPATMTYYVDIKPEALPDIQYPTNDVTSISYTNANGVTANKLFNIP